MNHLSGDDKKNGVFLDLKDLSVKVQSSWTIFVFSIIFCFSLGIFYLFYATPRYLINAKILIQDDKNTGGNTAAMMDFAELFGGSSSVDNEVQVLDTRYLMDILVRNENLNFTWFEKKGIKLVEQDIPPYQLEVFELADSIKSTPFQFELKDSHTFSLDYEDPLTEEDTIIKAAFDKVFDIPNFGRFKIRNPEVYNRDKEYTLMISSIDSKVESLRSNLAISATNKLASTISVQFEYPLPAKGERILKGYIDEYIHQDIADKSRIADSTIRFIDERILLVNQELNGIEGNIQTFMQGKGLANISEQARLLLESDKEYIAQLSQIDNKIQVLTSTEELLKDKNNKRLVAGSVLSDDQAFVTLINSYNSLALEKERLLLAYKEDNPFVTNINKRIEAVEDNILSYINSTKSTLEVSKKEIQRNSSKLRGNIRDVPEQERKFLDLSRQQQLKQELYLFLLQKREETALSNTSNIAGVRVIDPPKSQFKPFSPKKPLILFVTLLFSFGLPLVYVYGKEFLNTKVQNRKDIERYTQLPVIAEFTHNTAQTDLIEFKSSRSALAEQFRGLRTNLQFMMPKLEDKVILITSGMPGEGKSFTSLNLANIYAVSGKKVLLLEFDLRKPKLSKTYTGLSKVGISNYIVDQSLILDDMINPVDEERNLYFGACGPIPPNPAELILSDRVTQMMNEARERFDYVIIDAPPIGAVTDGQLLSTYSDVSIYVVRSGYTPHELLGLPEDVRREGKMKNMAIVLNDVNEGAGGYYGYNYGYYHSDDIKKPWWKFGNK